MVVAFRGRRSRSLGFRGVRVWGPFQAGSASSSISMAYGLRLQSFNGRIGHQISSFCLEFRDPTLHFGIAFRRVPALLGSTARRSASHPKLSGKCKQRTVSAASSQLLVTVLYEAREPTR